MTQELASTRIPATKLNSFIGKSVTLVGIIDEVKASHAIMKEGSGVVTLMGRDIPSDGIVQVKGIVNSQLQVQVEDVLKYDYSGTQEEALQLYTMAIQ